MTLFRNNRERLVSRLQSKKEEDKNTYIVLQGGVEVPFNDTDIEITTFRQVRTVIVAYRFVDSICQVGI